MGLVVQFRGGPIDGDIREIQPGDHYIVAELGHINWLEDVDPATPVPMIQHTYRRTRDLTGEGAAIYHVFQYTGWSDR